MSGLVFSIVVDVLTFLVVPCFVISLMGDLFLWSVRDDI